MDIQQSIKTCFKKYATFEGRASRSEFWWFQVFYLMVTIVAVFLDYGFGIDNTEFAGPLELVSGLILLIHGLAVNARRLHDVGRSGWWILVSITIIGLIPLFIWWLSAGTNKKNKHGNPIKNKS